MGNRANSYLGFGIVFREWDEETHQGCVYELAEKIEEEAANLGTAVLGDACENEVFLFIGESYTGGDWDDPEEVDVDRLDVKENWSGDILAVCKKYGIEAQEPKLLMVSDWS